MLGRVAKGAYVVFVVAMIAAWAASAGRSTPAETKNAEPVIWNWNI
jgi:hypothetical protein